MRQYLDLLQDVLDNGTERDDRTGVGTIAVFGRQIRFNMADGFPAVTTKALAWKAVVSELLWFLEGSTNEHRLAEIKNDNKPYAELTEKERKTIWTANYENQGKALGYTDGYLGNIYGHQWSNLFTINFDEFKIEKKKPYIDDYEHPRPATREIKYNNDLAGQVLTSKKGYKCVVFDVEHSQKNGVHNKYWVQFFNTGSVKSFRKNQLTTGDFVDNYEKNVFGIGCTGDEITKINHQHTREYMLWSSMLQRCYSKTNKRYHNYGGKGVFVCKRWHYFANFKRDIEKLPFYQQWKQGLKYELDKDVKGGMVYSPETCVFIPHDKNRVLSRTKEKFIVYKNKLYSDVCNLHEHHPELSVEKIRYMLHKHINEQELHRIVLKEDEYVTFTYSHINQIQNAIDLIKNEPNSRRNVVSAWNIYDLDNMALVPCHYSFQFHVDGNKLSLMYQMRSNDLFLGCPFNIASYALLLHIVAKITGKIPHELIGSLGNTHVYKNHLEQVKEQLTRTPHKLPTLQLPENADYSNIDTFLKSVKTSDFKLLDYEHDGKLTAPMAV